MSAAIVLVGLPAGSVAEFICRSDVSYTWIPAPAPKTGTGTPPPGQNDVANAAGSEKTVRFAYLEKSGVDEASGKAALTIDLNRAKARASETCKKEHENFAGCVSTKFGVQAAILAGLSFTARRELEKAITEDCKSEAGTCLGVVSSDPVCEERKVEQPTPPAAEAGKDKKKK